MTLQIRRWDERYCFQQGKAAFLAGQTDSECPYKSKSIGPVNQSEKRQAWMNGFYQAKYGDKWEGR